MTEPRPASRKPGGAAVFWASLALFGVLFALLTYQLSQGGGPGGTGAVASRPVQLRKVIKKRVVTTVVPTPGVDRVTSSPATTSGEEEVPVEPITTSSS